MDYGFVRVGAAVPRLKVADTAHNADRIIGLIGKAESAGVRVLVFPELCLTAYTCGDLFFQRPLVSAAERELGRVLERTRGTGLVAAVGLPVAAENRLFNCAAVIHGGRILGVVPKSYIPGYKEFYEERWFASGLNVRGSTVLLCGAEVPFGTDLLFRAEGRDELCIGVEICEDLWAPVPPSSRLAVGGATLLLNLSASNEIVGKSEYRRSLVTGQAARCVAAYVYTSSGPDESSTDLVFGGHAIVSDYGAVLAESERFALREQLVVSEVDLERLASERRALTPFMEGRSPEPYRTVAFRYDETPVPPLHRKIDPHPFVPADPEARDRRCEEIFSIQTAGLAKRYRHTGLSHAVIGVSGGLDSTLALLVTVRTFDLLELPRKNVIAVTMPGFGTTDATYTNALRLMRALEVEAREIPIAEAATLHFRDIGHDPSVHDVTYENAQARERTQILMDLSNRHAGLVIGTGDLSELALGFATYNGDHMSMYGVNASIPKTLVRYLIGWAADNVVSDETRAVLQAVLDTPISPELLPPDENGAIRQKTEEIVGPYELHDFFLYHVVRYGAPPAKVLFLARTAFGETYSGETIKKWLAVFYRRFFAQQFKRSCLPDGPKVGTVSLSPRGDWRMPSDASAALWLAELEEVQP
jgi:NAD+ synthase (glutamine-hydrolysing)